MSLLEKILGPKSKYDETLPYTYEGFAFLKGARNTIPISRTRFAAWWNICTGKI